MIVNKVVGRQLDEVGGECIRINVVLEDIDVVVAIRPSVFVVEAHGVSYLMTRRGGQSRLQKKCLFLFIKIWQVWGRSILGFVEGGDFNNQMVYVYCKMVDV